MSYIYEFLDEHMVVCGAVIFGIVAIGSCIAVAAAMAGAL